MSYTPTTWASGDTVTSALLNKLEQGVANMGISYLEITEINDVANQKFTLNKTVNQILNAYPYCYIVISDTPYNFIVTSINEDAELTHRYYIAANTYTYHADSLNEYPYYEYVS